MILDFKGWLTENGLYGLGKGGGAGMTPGKAAKPAKPAKAFSYFGLYRNGVDKHDNPNRPTMVIDPNKKIFNPHPQKLKIKSKK